MSAYPISLGARHAHHYGNLAPGVACATAPPLHTVDNVYIAMAIDGGLDVGGITGGDFGLRHTEAGADLSLQQGLQPCLLLGLAAVKVEDFHIAWERRGKRQSWGMKKEINP